MKERKRIPTDGEPVAWKSPFAALKMWSCRRLQSDLGI